MCDHCNYKSWKMDKFAYLQTDVKGKKALKVQWKKVTNIDMHGKN